MTEFLMNCYELWFDGESERLKTNWGLFERLHEKGFEIRAAAMQNLHLLGAKGISQVQAEPMRTVMLETFSFWKIIVLMELPPKLDSLE